MLAQKTIEKVCRNHQHIMEMVPKSLKFVILVQKSFNFIRIVLPDHKHDRSITFKEIEDSISTLVNLLEGGKVYVHCYAGLERSPLICMGYLIYKKNLNLVESLEYIMSINPGSSPMQNNLNQLENYFLRKVNIVNSDNEI